MKKISKKLQYFVAIYAFWLIVAAIVFRNNFFEIRQNFTYLPDWFNAYIWFNLIGKLLALSLLPFKRCGLYLLLALIFLEFIVGTFIVQTNFWFWPQFIAGLTTLALFVIVTLWAVDGSKESH